jgi:hypothetical protein
MEWLGQCGQEPSRAICSTMQLPRTSASPSSTSCCSSASSPSLKSSKSARNDSASVAMLQGAGGGGRFARDCGAAIDPPLCTACVSLYGRSTSRQRPAVFATQSPQRSPATRLASR